MIHKRRDVYNVKIFCISPFEILSKFLDKLIQFEYEVYNVNKSDKNRLIKILDRKIPNIIFFCIYNVDEIMDWVQFLKKIDEIDRRNIEIGLFVKDHIDQKTRNIFLNNNVPVIQESFLHKHPLKAIKAIFNIFEAKGIRKHIRVSGFGVCEAYFYYKLMNIKENIKGDIIDISSHAFSCRIELKKQIYFVPGFYLNEVILSLRGVRIPVAAKILGFSKDDSNLFVFQMFNMKIKENKFYYDSKLPVEKSNKIYNYIKYALKIDITKKLKSQIIDKE